MAKDLIGELGLDVAEIQKALGLVNKQLDGLQKAADKTSESTSKIEKGFSKLAEGAKKLAVALGVTFGIKAIIDYTKSFQNLHAEIQKTRSKLAEGSQESKQFNASVDSVHGGEASGLAIKAAVTEISNYSLKFKEKASKELRQLGEGLSRDPNPLHVDISDGGAKKTAQTKEMEGQDIYNQETVNRGKKIVDLQHELVAAQGNDMGIKRNQLAALEVEARLQFEIMEYAARTGVADENMRAAAVRGYAAANTAHINLSIEVSNELKAARAITTETQLNLQGMSGAAKQAKILAEYAEKIAKANREGKEELVKQLEAQRELALVSLGIDEHNMTPKQRRDERNKARKYNRDKKKAEDHEKDLEDRRRKFQDDDDKIKRRPGESDDDFEKRKRREHPGPTPGSELDRYMHRNAGAGAVVGAPNGDSAEAKKFFSQGLADLDAIKANFDNAFISR